MKQSSLLLFFIGILLILLGSVYSVDSKREKVNSDIGYGIIFSGCFTISISLFVMFIYIIIK